jgi:hypothetical protein
MVTQKRLNHIAVLHCHREQSQSLDLEAICNSFIVRNEYKTSSIRFVPYIGQILLMSYLIMTAMFLSCSVIFFVMKLDA